MNKSVRLLQKSLLEHAVKLTRSGMSVIPVFGDGSANEPKKPTLPWRRYQKECMSEVELRCAFTGKASALGIVCGRVSSLLVIDFDDHLRYRRFCRHRPDLADTYTVKTRRGFHAYYRTMQKVPTHQFEGGDIKGERSYVVAPPSVIGGVSYRAITHVKPRSLDEGGVDSLLNYLHGGRQGKRVWLKRVQEKRDVDLRAMYERLAPQIGRNNALYRAASAGRDAGMTKSRVEGLLSEAHVLMSPKVKHRFESVEERLAEAERSIRSAYSGVHSVAGSGASLPNSVRERLLKTQGSTVVARFLDIMVLAGWECDSYFSLKEATIVAEKFGVNRKSVLKALTGELSCFNGRHIIGRRYVEYMDIGGLNSRRRGRRAVLMFQVPSVGRLQWVLNVVSSPSDFIEAKDVSSAHAYRRALHREYIRRLSPRLPMRVMADRLGVNVRTLRRYNRELEVRSTTCIGRFALSWDKLALLPKRRRRNEGGVTPGYWLETSDGYRAPAWRHIGAEMLRRSGAGVWVCAQGASVWYLSGKPVAPLRIGSLSPDEFLRLRVLREDAGVGAGVREALQGLLKRARQVAAKVRYGRVRLFYESVGARIAEDKVAETIGGYLCAVDEDGVEVRRPARRGVAYRMLKEFGNGNVFLALRESYREVMVELAGYAAREGGIGVGMEALSAMLA